MKTYKFADEVKAVVLSSNQILIMDWNGWSFFTELTNLFIIRIEFEKMFDSICRLFKKKRDEDTVQHLLYQHCQSI